MNKLSFVIIGPSTENTLDLVREIEKTGHRSFIVKLSDIFFEFNNGAFKALWKNKDLLDFDIFLLRGYNKNLLFAQILAQELLVKGKIVIDDTIGKRFISSKIYEASRMAQNKINHPRTWQAVSFSSYKKILKQISFPVIAKPVYGQKGQGIEKFKTAKEYLSFFSKNPKGYLIQEFLNIDGDIRVFIVGNKVLGAMKRHLVPGDFRSNASLGARTEKIPLTKELKTLALKAAKTMDYEIAGVDILEYKKKFYVLEINSSPQWQKFKEVTGINPAKYIIEYALKKYAGKHR
ncbi:MAG: RimK family alpha-L-glutamate ligase [Parcubacteria group bacterium]